METTVYNPQKGSLETIDVEFTRDNATWFNQCKGPRDISMIADFDGDLLICEFSHTYPIRIYDTSRADIAYDQKKALQLRRRYE